MKRRNFTLAVQGQILARATDASGMVKCEHCGFWCKSRKNFEFDHIVPEALRPEADKVRPLTAAEGQLLCLKCHRRLKTLADMADIAKAKHREAAHKGLTRPGKGKFPRREQDAKPPLVVVLGRPGMARRYQ
jgi:hypothetical protein